MAAIALRFLSVSLRVGWSVGHMTQTGCAAQSIIILPACQPISVQLSVLLSYNNKQAAFVKSLVTLINVTQFYYKITNFISPQMGCRPLQFNNSSEPY